jgi:hypothetical protein
MTSDVSDSLASRRLVLVGLGARGALAFAWSTFASTLTPERDVS